MAKRKSTATVTFTLRIQESLRSQLEAAAKRNGVSLNEEMRRRLVSSFSSAQLAEQAAHLVAVSESLQRLEQESAAMKAALVKHFPSLEGRK